MPWHGAAASSDVVVTPQLMRTMKGHSHWVMSVAVSPDGRFVYSGSYDNTVKQWESSSGAVRAVTRAALRRCCCL